MRFEAVRILLLLVGSGAIISVAVFGALQHTTACEQSDDASVTVLGVTLTLRNGATVTPAVVRQVEALRNCTSNTAQPHIVLDDLDPLGAHYNHGHDGCGKRIVYGPTKDSHLSLLIHEMAHYFEDTAYGFKMPCAAELYSQMVPGDADWGDNGGYPYCYNRAVPNAAEYVAILSEGYCTGECGPTFAYLNDSTRSIATAQLKCAQTLMGPRPP